MAIIIPSRSIYKIQNPKVRDNLVDKVEVAVTEVTPNNDYEVAVKNISLDNSYFSSNSTKTDYDEDFASSNILIWNSSKSYVELKSTYLNDYFINFSAFKDNSYINKVFYGLNKKDETNIKYTVYYNKKVYETYADNISQNADKTVNISGFRRYLKEETEESGVLPQPTISISSSNSQNPYASSQAKVEETNLTNISTTKIEYDSSNEEYSSNVTILVGLETMTLTGIKHGGSTLEEVEVVSCKGEQVIYTPKSVEITFYGDTIGIDLTDKTITIGEGNKPLSFDGNELMQTTNRLNTATSGEVGAVEYLYENTLNAFKYGKETATIRCSIGEYKDQSGNVVISPNRDERIFKVGDEVIPMVYTNIGDKAMSNYKDGNDKIFKVLATNIHAQGVAWQDLTLQEK